MTYEDIQQLNPPQFKRFCGVSRDTLRAMVSVLSPHLDRRGKRGGQPKLSVEDQLLVTLEYWREYRTQFHIAQAWGIHEARVCRIVRKVENPLIRSGVFRLPGKRNSSNPNSPGRSWSWM
jgi:Helix-turn-helix of DDE superfamily endonuclease